MQQRLWVSYQALFLTLVVACLFGTSALADNNQLRSQVRDRQRVVETEMRTLQLERQQAEFGGRLYWQLNYCVNALERERLALNRLDNALFSRRQPEIDRYYAEYRRAQQESMRRGGELARMRSNGLTFGSSAWHANQRVASAQQQQRGAAETFGRQYRNVLEAQIRFLETRRSEIEFGTSQWHAMNRQISALRQGLNSIR